MSIDAGSIHSRLDIDTSPYMDGLDLADRRQNDFVRTVERRYPKIKADASPFEQSLRHANKLVDDLERNIIEANRSELRIDSKAFLKEIERAEEAVKVLELQMMETNNFELEVEIGKLKSNVEKAKGAIKSYDDLVEEAKNQVLSIDVGDMEKSMVLANRRIDAYMQSVETASQSELNIRTTEYQQAMNLALDRMNDYQKKVREASDEDLTVDISGVQKSVAVAKSAIVEYQEKVKTASKEELKLEAQRVFDAMNKARSEVEKYQSEVKEAQNLKMTLDTSDISASLAEVRTGLSTTRTAFDTTFSQAEQGVATFTNKGKQYFNEFGGVTGKFATVLRMDVGDSVKESAMKLATLEAEVRKNSRQFGSYSEQVQRSRKAMTDYALSLDDATFKSIYIDSKTQAHNRSIQQQASQIKLNARMMGLMGDQTEITARRLDALVEAGARADEIFATPKTIGQVTLLNRMLENSNGSLVTMSSHTRKIWQNIDDQVKSWSVNKIAQQEAKRATAGIADETARAKAEARMVQENITVYSQQLMAWQTVAVGLLAGSMAFYSTVFKTAMESNAQLREEFESTKKKVLEAFEPMIEIASDFALKVLDAVSAVADWVAKFNEANPVLAEFAGALALILPALTLLMSPMMITGQLVSGMKIAINGLNTLLGTLGASFTITGASMALIIGPAIAVASAIAVIIVACRQNEEALFSLQEKYGAIGTVISTVMEKIQGHVQMGVGNIIIMLETLAKVVVAVLNKEWSSVPGIWKEGWAKMENNTAIALSNINAETTKAYTTMQKLTDEQMGSLEKIFSEGLPSLENLTDKSAGGIAKRWAEGMSDVKGETITMSQDVIDTAKGLNDTTAVIFEGIREGMTVEEATKKLEANFESMARSGSYSSEELEKASTEALELIEQTVETTGNAIQTKGEEAFNSFAKASQIGMNDALAQVASNLGSMNQATVDGLSGMGTTWEGAFKGLGDITNLSHSEILSILKTNFKDMGMTQEEFLSSLESEWVAYGDSLVDTTSASFETMQTVTGDMLTSMEQKLEETSKNGSTSMETLATNLMSSVTDMGVSGEDMRSLGDTFKTVFDGIELNGSMSSKEVREKVTENLKGLNLTGSEILELFKTESESTFEGISSSAEKESKKTKEDWEKESKLANETGSKNFQELAKNIDGSNKDATKSTETETKKQKKAVEENTAESNKTGSKNSKELSDNIKDDVTESAVVTAKEAKKINKAINENLSDSTKVTQKEMAEMNKAIQQNATNMYNGVNTSFTKMSQICKQATSDMYNGINTSFSKMSQICKQSASDMYNGVSTSFSKLTTQVKQSASDMYNGVNTSFTKLATQVKQQATNMYNGAKTSFESMANSAKQSASNMYNGVTGSTSKMANQAISDWNRVKSAYRASVTANVYIKVHGLQQALNAIQQVKNATRNSIQMTARPKSVSEVETYDDSYNELLRDSINIANSYKSAQNVIEFKVTDNTKKDEKKKKEAKAVEMNVNFNIKEVNTQSEHDVHRFMEEVTDVLKREFKATGGAY